MATVRSLIVWGGSAGKAVTLTIASPCVVTSAAHGMRAGTALRLSTTGALPTGLTAGTTYYVNSTGTNTFNLYDTAANAVSGGATGRVNTSGTQSGTHTAKSAYSQTADLSRYGTTRVYNGLASWRSARNTAVPSAYDDEVVEIYDGFVDTITADTDIDWGAASTTITTMVNETRSAAAFHAGVIGSTALSSSGYCVYVSGSINGIDITAGNVTVDGIFMVAQNSSGICIRTARFGTTVKNCVIRGNKPAGAGSQAGIRSNQPAVGQRIYNNIVLEIGGGGFYTAADQGAGALYYNNLAHNCNVGFYHEGANNRGFFYNNISVGNDTNWSAQSIAIEAAAYNGGESGNTPWNTGDATAITTFDSTDFTNYATHDFTPASLSAPQVETGINVPNEVQLDILAGYRPSYMGSLEGTDVTAGSFVVGQAYVISTVGTTDFALVGASASTIGVRFKATGVGTGTGTATLTSYWDVGPFEYDWGNGLPPVKRNMNFTGLQSGSQVIIYTTNTTTELSRTNSSGTTLTYDTAGATVDYTILKAGYKPIRVTGVALTAESTPVSVQQDLDRAYVTPSGLTFGTTIGVGGCNFIAPVTSLAVTSLRVSAATTVQNWYSAMMDAWIASATNTTLKNVAFPVIPFGEASFTVINGVQFSDGATSIAFFKHDGLRYSSDAGTTITAIWAAILTLNTPAGQQVKYRQATVGTIVNASNTGPMDQLVQVMSDPNGDGVYTDGYDYRGHMVLRAPKPGWSQPQPDLVATYGNLVDGLFVAALEPLLQYATTDADIDAANLVLDSTAKTYTITAAHTMLELYQRAQWWANQDAQWDADIPLTTTNGGTFTQPSNWSMIGVANLTGGTLAGGEATLAAGTQGIAYNGVTLNLGAAGTYTFTADTCTISATPTGASTYALSGGALNGTMDLRNTTAFAITMELPSGTTYTTASNTGGVITVTFPVNVANINITNMPIAGNLIRLQIYNLTTDAIIYSDDPAGAAYSASYTDGVGITAGDTLRVRFVELNAGTSLKFFNVLVEAAITGFNVDALNFLEEDDVYSTNAIDGSSVTVTNKFSADFALPNPEINLKVASNFIAAEYYAYYCYLLTDATGIGVFWGGITAADVGNYRINVSVCDMKLDNETTASKRQTDASRIYRSDGVYPVKDPTTSGFGIDVNWQNVVYVVSTGGSALTPAESAYLLALPTAGATADAVWDEPIADHATAGSTGATLSGASAPSAATVAEAVHAEVIEGGKTFAEITRIAAATLAGTSLKAGNTITFKGIDGTTDRVVGSFDAENNRTGAVLDGS